MVETLLLPIAQLGFIQPDIRPGFEVTSIVLCQVKRKWKSKLANMFLIDYESFIKVDHWEPPCSNHLFKFIDSDDCESVETLVWRQCLAMAYAWMAVIQIPKTNECTTYCALGDCYFIP